VRGHIFALPKPFANWNRRYHRLAVDVEVTGFAALRKPDGPAHSHARGLSSPGKRTTVFLKITAPLSIKDGLARLPSGPGPRS
jgi:hypothetical protein